MDEHAHVLSECGSGECVSQGIGCVLGTQCVAYDEIADCAVVQEEIMFYINVFTALRLAGM